MSNFHWYVCPVLTKNLLNIQIAVHINIQREPIRFLCMQYKKYKINFRQFPFAFGSISQAQDHI